MHFDVNTGKLIDDDGSIVESNEAVTPIQNSGEYNPALHYGPEDEARAKMVQNQVKQVKKTVKIKRSASFHLNGKLIVFLCILAVLIIAGITTAICLPAKTKINLMTYATFNEEPMFGDLQKPLLISKKANTILLNGNYYSTKYRDLNGSSLEYRAQRDYGKKEISTSGSLQIGETEKLMLQTYQDSDKIVIALPGLSTYILSYNYNSKDNNGDLFKLLKSDDIEEINDRLRGTFENPDTTNSTNSFYDSLHFVKSDKKKFQINGKDCNCNGYRASMNANELKKYLDQQAKRYDSTVLANKSKSNFSGSMAVLNNMNPYEILKNSIKDTDVLYVSIYYNRFKLAAIEFESEENVKTEILFQGGHYRMENMVIKVVNDDNEVLLAKKGSTQGSLHNFTLTLTTDEKDYDLCGGFYNEKSGEFECSNSENKDGLNIKGKLKTTLTSMHMRFDNLQTNKDSHIVGDIDIARGANIVKMDSKDSIDLGNATIGDFQTLILDMADKMPIQLANLLKNRKA